MNAEQKKIWLISKYYPDNCLENLRKTAYCSNSADTETSYLLNRQLMNIMFDTI
jgi:hypothetical protein